LKSYYVGQPQKNLYQLTKQFNEPALAEKAAQCAEKIDRNLHRDNKYSAHEHQRDLLKHWGLKIDSIENLDHSIDQIREIKSRRQFPERSIDQESLTIVQYESVVYMAMFGKESIPYLKKKLNSTEQGIQFGAIRGLEMNLDEDTLSTLRQFWSTHPQYGNPYKDLAL
jgi:hypothetical protein